MKLPQKWRAAACRRLLATALIPLAYMSPTARAADTARNPWRQPYFANSVWNVPIGSNASLANITVSPNGIGQLEGDVTYLYFYNPADPVRSVYLPGTTTSYFSTQIPDNYLDDTSYGFSPNNPAFIMSGDSYGLELQPFRRSGVGANVDAYNASYNGAAFFSILGDGLHGSHFGSGLTAMGGCLRVDELTSGGNIRHALQIELPTYRLYKNTGSNNNRNETYRWPASTSDGDISDYGAQNTSNSDLRMGSLLTMRAGTTESSLGLTTAPGKKLFWTLTNYGAYIVDTSGFTSYQPNNADYVNIGIEAGAKQQFRDTFGYEFAVSSPENNAWFRDLNAIYKNLVVVANNTETNVGGGGTPRDSGRLTALAYGVRKDVSNGTQIEAEDYNVGGPEVGYHDTDTAQNGRVGGTYNRDGGGGYRNDAVDVYPTVDADNCAPGFWGVGWTAAGEWLKYDINVTSAGTYTLSVRLASGASGGQLHFEDENGNTLGGTISVGGTGGWDTYTTVTSSSFALSAGFHTIRLAENTGGYNVNWFKFATGTGGGGGGALVNGSVYQIEPQCAPGKTLDVNNVSTADQANVQTYDYLGGANQQWKAIDVGNGYWEFEPRHAIGKRLDVAGAANADFANVWQYTSNSGAAQRWKLIANGDGSYALEPQCAPGRVLDVSSSSNQNQANVQIYTSNGSSAQRWKFYVK